MKEYNKLVRDNIPSIIRESGKECNYKVLETANQMERALKTKLKEEINEYFKDNTIEELVDLEEIILTLASYKGYSQEKFEELRKTKLNERGGFSKGIMLKGVEE